MQTSSAQPSQQDRPAAGGGRSHFAAGAKIKGDLTVPGLIELLGELDGTVQADAIVIEAAGTVTGDLKADSITIKGRFEGRINGGAVKLLSGAKVSGEISYSSLNIESGAEVNSSCTRTG
ncbi:bactofilin family protein [Marinibacterium profundimaris]|uniref:Integral membrane protein CcmA involved in cell shape determination n=1 Tax=Marinibacterium profundimaris TaxID=1679460 RepID=A0A225NLK5_9RHOB|nr:polymer-forming cytoskeletal protein [Marinibacterium profundimaris]OWU71008.1 hypothetical protein ATO3_19425 [Marinibacterium profundimaris]